MRSLLAPLALGLVLSLAAVLGVQWSLVRAGIDTGMREFIAEELSQDAEELYSGLVVMTPGSEVSLALTHYDPAFLTPDSGRYFQVMEEHRVVLRSPSLAGFTLPAAPLAAGRRAETTAAGPKEQSLLVNARGFDFEGRRVTIVAAADLRPTQAHFDRILARYTEVSLSMFALLVVLQVVIVRVALSPLRRVQEDVGRLERGEITQLGEAVPAEVAPLVREINRLLALVAQRLQRMRDSLGNLAHALKAPLTVLNQVVEDERIRREPGLHGELRQQLDALRERIDSELRRARVAGGRAMGALPDLPAEIESLAATVRKLHRDRDLAVEVRIEPAVRFGGEREDLLELCGNLLDNACKWARSRVRFSARLEQGRTVLAVEDDGPGCPAEDLERLARRGVRLDEAAEGHGLGLAIARSIAASYGAELRLGRSAALGGFEARVEFSAA